MALLMEATGFHFLDLLSLFCRLIIDCGAGRLDCCRSILNFTQRQLANLCRVSLTFQPVAALTSENGFSQNFWIRWIHYNTNYNRGVLLFLSRGKCQFKVFFVKKKILPAKSAPYDSANRRAFFASTVDCDNRLLSQVGRPCWLAVGKGRD